MTEKICFEFDEFLLDPIRGSLVRGGRPTQLRAKPFDLLLALVQRHGQALSKEELMSVVWPGSIVSDDNFHVNLDAVRKALGESGRDPHYIVRTSGGYCFVGAVREVPAKTIGEKTSAADQVQDATAVSRRPHAAHIAHVVISCSLYAALYSVSAFLEVAYEFDRFGGMAWKIAPFVFAWMAICSVAGLTADRKLTSQGRSSGLAASAATFLIAALALLVVLTRLLPPFPITQSTLQSYPAQAAYLKDTSYFLVLAFCFLIVPFHFIVTVEREIERGQCDHILRLLTGHKLSAAPKGTLYARFWALAAFLVVLAAFSLFMTSRLLDHLKPGPYMNLFTQLVYLRAILYFGLGIECLIWYYRALEELKNECLIHRQGHSTITRSSGKASEAEGEKSVMNTGNE